MDSSYDYMKSLLPVPSHSVQLNPMSGGAIGDLPSIPEGNDETKNVNNNSNGFPTEEKPSIAENVTEENATQFAEGEENVFGVFDFSKNAVAAKQEETPLGIKEFNVGGDIYYVTDVDDASKIILGDENIKAIISDFHLELLDEVKQKEFIFSLLKCSDLNSIVQGPVCDPLIENISYLITKINDKYSSVVQAKDQTVAQVPEESIEREEIGVVPIRKFKSVCNVEGDGWCLYRALLLAKYLLKTDSDDCETDAAKKFRSGNDEEIATEIKKIVQFIKTEIANNTVIGRHFSEAITVLVSNPETDEDIDADYYKQWKVVDVATYLDAMAAVQENDSKFFGDVQIAGMAFAIMNSVSLNIYEDAYIIKDVIDASGNKTVVKVRKDGSNYRKSMASADLFKMLGLPVAKDTLHIYHSGRIHFKVLVTKRTLNARLNAIKNIASEPVAPNEPPVFNQNGPLISGNTNIKNAFNLGLNRSVAEFKNINEEVR